MKTHEMMNSQTGPLYFFSEWIKYVARNQCTFLLFHYRLRQAIQARKMKLSIIPFIYILSLLPIY